VVVPALGPRWQPAGPNKPLQATAKNAPRLSAKTSVSRNPYPEQANVVPNSKQKPMWKPESVGEVIAEREFALTSPSGRNARIRIRFGKPVRGKGTSRRDPWWCPVEVRGAGLDSFHPVAGIDSLQALILALEFVSRVLPDKVEGEGLRMEWLGDTERLVLARHALSRGVEDAMLSLFVTLRDVAATLSSNEKDERRATVALRRIVNAAKPGGRSQG
jgi:hypothetical protein